MKNKTLLAYVNTNAYTFNYTDINFDTEYFFELELRKELFKVQYILYVSRRVGIKQPEGFWGDNICSLNMVLGENGAGKTSFFRLMINNIRSGLTTMNGEFVIYIIKYKDKYILFSNASSLRIEKSEDAKDINLFTEKEYYNELKREECYEPPFDNKRFWKNIIYFSNYFATTGISKSGYVINVSKDIEIDDIINKEIPKNREKYVSENNMFELANIYSKYRTLKIFDYLSKEEFRKMSITCKVSTPNLLKISLNSSREIVHEYYDSNRFPYNRWIGKKRYEIYQYDSGEYYYEAALNKFSVLLMLFLEKEKLIKKENIINFIDELAKTSDKTGIEIAYEHLSVIQNDKINIWINLLQFINKKSSDNNSKFILYWQTDKEFCCRLDENYYDFIRKLLSLRLNEDCFSFELVGSEQNGYYSSGEESKLSVFIALYEALQEIRKSKGHSNNLIILLDEIDAFFHPKYQINIIGELLEIISKAFSDYNVQIIIASNTPLELSDIPAKNIVYLKDGKAVKNQNEIVTFGSNVCSLLKNQFYINATMGSFAKNKINKVISFLRNDSTEVMSKEEVKYIISIIGEPIIKSKLQEMYDKKYPEELFGSENIEYYKNRISELQKIIKNSKTIDVSELESLESELEKISIMIKDIKEER